MKGDTAFSIYASFQVTTASISFLASSTVAAMITKASYGAEASSVFNSPYHRLVLALSVSDVISSLGMLTGPFMAPTGVDQAKWAIGNNATCKVTGSFVTFGSGCTPLYVCALCFYCMCKIRKHMSDSEFATKIEFKLHAVIILFNLCMVIAAQIKESIALSLVGSMCLFASTPTGCRQNPELYGDCIEPRSGNSVIFLMIWIFGVSLSCLSGIVFCMFMIYAHVTSRNIGFQGSPANQNHTRGARANSTKRRCDDNSFSSSSNSGEGFVDEIPQVAVDSQNSQLARDNSLELVKTYKREFVVQASLYVFAFLLTYLTVWISLLVSIIAEEEPSDFVKICTSIFYPIGGALNILVFTRPKVLTLRRRNPDRSWIWAFVAVIMAGGAVPEHSTEDNHRNSPHQTNVDTGVHNSVGVSSGLSYEATSNNGGDSSQLSFSRNSSSAAHSSGRFALSSGNTTSKDESSTSTPEPTRKYYSGTMRGAPDHQAVPADEALSKYHHFRSDMNRIKEDCESEA